MKQKEFIETGAYHTAASSRTIEFCQNETSYSNNLLAQLHVKDLNKMFNTWRKNNSIKAWQSGNITYMKNRKKQ
jgi:hypothetical protein